MTNDFIQHRVYLTGGTARTVHWGKNALRQFDGALDRKTSIIGRIAELKGRGVSHVTINSYRRAVNAYFAWLPKELGKELIQIPRHKEEQNVLSTLGAEHVDRITQVCPGVVEVGTPIVITAERRSPTPPHPTKPPAGTITSSSSARSMSRRMTL